MCTSGIVLSDDDLVVIYSLEKEKTEVEVDPYADETPEEKRGRN